MQASAESIYEGLTTLLGVPYDRDKMTLHVNQRASFVPPNFPLHRSPFRGRESYWF
jgi:hypothetical protein